MKTRFFFVIYLHNDTVRGILDGMRLIADPMQRNFSHITVKGPYRNIQKKRLFEDSKLIEGKEIRVSGAGNFFTDNQNTVFLKCEEKQELYTIWKTKEGRTYSEFHPHITIYDGADRSFANKLFSTIDAHKINFSFIVEKLELYSSADKTKLFNLNAQLDYSLLSKITGINIRPDNIDKLSDQQRISAIDKLCGILERVNGLHDVRFNAGSLHEHSLLLET
jgi:2'-5' RNA ligase